MGSAGSTSSFHLLVPLAPDVVSSPVRSKTASHPTALTQPDAHTGEGPRQEHLLRKDAERKSSLFLALWSERNPAATELPWRLGEVSFPLGSLAPSSEVGVSPFPAQAHFEWQTLQHLAMTMNASRKKGPKTVATYTKTQLSKYIPDLYL